MIARRLNGPHLQLGARKLRRIPIPASDGCLSCVPGLHADRNRTEESPRAETEWSLGWNSGCAGGFETLTTRHAVWVSRSSHPRSRRRWPPKERERKAKLLLASSSIARTSSQARGVPTDRPARRRAGRSVSQQLPYSCGSLILLTPVSTRVRTCRGGVRVPV